MELRATREMRRNEQLRKTTEKREAASAPQPAQSAPRQAPADKLSLSRQALAWLDEQNRQDMERQARRDDSLSALKSSKSELDNMAKQLKAQEKCQKIAARIMRGDRVPPEDLEYLMNNDPEGYKLAMAMRRIKRDPEDCESVLDEEDRNGGTREAQAAPDGASSEASAPEAAE